MTTTPEQVLDRYHAAMLAADADAFADLYAPDATHTFPFVNPQGAGPLHGQDQIRAFYRTMWANLPVVLDRIETVSQHRCETDGMIINELVSIGRRRSDDQPFRLAGLVILTVRDGKIIETRDYLDAFGLQSQLS